LACTNQKQTIAHSNISIYYQSFIVYTIGETLCHNIGLLFSYKSVHTVNKIQVIKYPHLIFDSAHTPRQEDIQKATAANENLFTP
jgi:hypothetical protein